eukprot:COSAG02_NODE_3102_length_7368_cov_92.599120_7_plen_46_part_00
MDLPVPEVVLVIERVDIENLPGRFDHGETVVMPLPFGITLEKVDY